MMASLTGCLGLSSKFSMSSVLTLPQRPAGSSAAEQSKSSLLGEGSPNASDCCCPNAPPSPFGITRDTPAAEDGAPAAAPRVGAFSWAELVSPGRDVLLFACFANTLAMSPLWPMENLLGLETLSEGPCGERRTGKLVAFAAVRLIACLMALGGPGEGGTAGMGSRAIQL